jgi:hypothetical protein
LSWQGCNCIGKWLPILMESTKQFISVPDCFCRFTFDRIFSLFLAKFSGIRYSHFCHFLVRISNLAKL